MNVRVWAVGFQAAAVLVGTPAVVDWPGWNERRGGGEGAAGVDQIGDGFYSGWAFFHCARAGRAHRKEIELSDLERERERGRAGGRENRHEFISLLEEDSNSYFEISKICCVKIIWVGPSRPEILESPNGL